MGKSTQRPQMGQPVRAMRQAVKQNMSFDYSENGLELTGVSTHWTPEYKRVIDGVYVGYRFLQSGISKCKTAYDEDYKTWYEYGERVFKPMETQEVWLVVPSERENPVYVFPEDVIWEATKAD